MSVLSPMQTSAIIYLLLTFQFFVCSLSFSVYSPSHLDHGFVGTMVVLRWKLHSDHGFLAMVAFQHQLAFSSVYSTRHLSSAEDKNFPFCPQLRTRKTYGKQMLFSKPSTMAYLTMVVLLSWQLLTQY